MAAIRRPLMPTLCAAWPGALALARLSAVERYPFKLSDGLPFNYQALPLQLQFVMGPNDASAAASKGSFQLLLSNGRAMVPRTHPRALPFLNCLQQHPTSRLPECGDVVHFADEVSVSLHLHCSLRRLLHDSVNCVLDSARRAMPAPQ